MKGMAERVFLWWQKEEEDAYNTKLQKFKKAYSRIWERKVVKMFYQWRVRMVEDRWLDVERRNERLQQEMKILEDEKMVVERKLRNRKRTVGKVCLFIMVF